MSEVFDNNTYIRNFEKIFSDEGSKGFSEWTGKGHQSASISIDLNLNYLTDRKATSGSVW